MAIQHRLILWNPLRKFFGFGTDEPCKEQVQSRSLLFQLIESEVATADALLDLGDVDGCDQHLQAATSHMENLRGPENILMHRRLSELKEKRIRYHYPTPQ